LDKDIYGNPLPIIFTLTDNDVILQVQITNNDTSLLKSVVNSLISKLTSAGTSCKTREAYINKKGISQILELKKAPPAQETKVDHVTSKK
jgi:hypothetical protein